MDVSLQGSLPLMGVGVLTLLFSLCFCCYLYRLKRQGIKEAQLQLGFQQIVYRKQIKLPNESCPVCLEEFAVNDKVAVTQCNHAFHSSCLMPWLFENTTCPLCKTPINQRRGAGEYASLMPGLAVDL
ncbi:hypothetical protein LSAT2_026123 [Lamellibrachia satsuma]|nr:hypothetical protein LSAT2_026123 [Lamellibrachia satsuma]